MISLAEIRNLYKAQLIDIASRNKADNIRVFGSFVRGEQSFGSDLDLLVTLNAGADLFDLARMRRQASELLNMQIDILPDSCINKHIKQQILSEAQPL